jgi:hypothetical protein
MGMLKGSIKNEILAIKIAEIGAQGESAVFSVLSRDKKANFQPAQAVTVTYWTTAQLCREMYTMLISKKLCR